MAQSIHALISIGLWRWPGGLGGFRGQLVLARRFQTISVWGTIAHYKMTASNYCDLGGDYCLEKGVFSGSQCSVNSQGTVHIPQ